MLVGGAEGALLWVVIGRWNLPRSLYNGGADVSVVLFAGAGQLLAGLEGPGFGGRLQLVLDL